MGISLSSFRVGQGNLDSVAAGANDFLINASGFSDLEISRNVQVLADLSNDFLGTVVNGSLDFSISLDLSAGDLYGARSLSGGSLGRADQSISLISTGTQNKVRNEFNIASRAALLNIQGEVKANASGILEGELELVVNASFNLAGQDLGDLGDSEVSRGDDVGVEELLDDDLGSRFNDGVEIGIGGVFFSVSLIRKSGGFSGIDDGIDGISSDDLFTSSGLIVEDEIELDSDILRSQGNVELIVVSTIDDLSVSTVDSRDGVSFRVLQDLVDTEVDISGDLGVSKDVSNVDGNVSGGFIRLL